MLRYPLSSLLRPVLILGCLVLFATTTLAAEEEQIVEGLRLYQAGNEAAAADLLNAALAATGDASTWPEARFALASIALHRGEYAAALSRIASIPPEQRNDRMRLVEGEALLALELYSDAAATLRRIDENSLDASERLARSEALFQADFKRGERLSALWFAHRALEQASDDAHASRRLFSRITELLADPGTEPQLPEIAFMFNGKPIGAAARLEQVHRALARKDASRAKALIAQVDIGILPPESRTGAIELYSQLLGASWLQRTIGVLLPLSGKYARFGELVRRGIDLALEQSGPASKGVHLVYADSAADADTSREALRNLVRNDKVIAVTGAIVGSAAEAAAQQAQEEMVPLLTLSPREGLPEIGSFVFRDTLTPQMQAEAMARNAIVDRGLTDIAILYPDNRFGQSLATAFTAEVIRFGGVITGSEAYDPQATDFGRQIKLLKGENPWRNEESMSQKEILNDLFVPDKEQPFNALFIPDYAERVALIAPQLSYYGVEDTPLLGVGGWHSPELLRLAGDYVEGAVLVDAYFSDSDTPAVQQFIDRYRKKFNEEPTLLEAQGYDAAGILLQLLQNPQVRDREDLRQALLGMNEYPGVTGATRFDGSGESHKKLYVLQINQGRFELFVPPETELPAAQDTFVP